MFLSNLGGVPVFNLPTFNPSCLKESDISFVGGSPALPAEVFSFPTWIRPFGKVPGVITKVFA